MDARLGFKFIIFSASVFPFFICVFIFFSSIYLKFDYDIPIIIIYNLHCVMYLFFQFLLLLHKNVPAAVRVLSNYSYDFDKILELRVL